MEVLYFVNFLMTQISKLSDSNSDHAATNFEIEELVFELRNYSDKENTFVIGCFDDLLGSPIKKVWKIIE